MKIAALTMAYNEAKILPYFLRHYNYVDEIRILYETDSTDATLDLCKNMPHVQIKPIHIKGGLIDEEKVGIINEEIKQMTEFDWIYVLDTDELIYPDNHEDPRTFLSRQTADIVIAHMWQVYRHWSEADLDLNKYPLSQRLHGDPDMYSQVEDKYKDKNANSIKPIVIRRAAGVQFKPGNHLTNGNYSVANEIYRGVHWQMADYDLAVSRRMARKERISERNKQLRHGFQHFEITEDIIKKLCTEHTNDPKLPIFNIPNMSFLKYLSFEINDACPLTKVHQECPRNHYRWSDKQTDFIISTTDIISFTNLCMAHGFDGLLTLHYYNEPMETPGRIRTVIEEFPDRVSLWTNGILLDPVKDADIITGCHDVMITRYPGVQLDDFSVFPNVRFQNADLDGRAKDTEVRFDLRYNRCGRPNWEFIIDYHGYGHMCCGDWKAEMSIGNIIFDDPYVVLHRWNQWREELLKLQPWDSTRFLRLPKVCQICTTRSPLISQAGV